MMYGARRLEYGGWAAWSMVCPRTHTARDGVGVELATPIGHPQTYWSGHPETVITV